MDSDDPRRIALNLAVELARKSDTSLAYQAESVVKAAEQFLAFLEGASTSMPVEPKRPV